MIDELRGAPVLRGVRGRPAADLAALAQLISDLGRAMVDHPAWREVDLNPVIAGPLGAIAVDALIVDRAPPRVAACQSSGFRLSPSSKETP